MAKLSNLRHFLRDVVNMSGAEAGSYTNLVRKAGVNTDEQEAILLSHLKDKYKQGSVGGDHFDDNLDDVFKSALGVRSFDGDTGLGGRVYSAGDLHSKVKLKSHKEQVLQDRQWDRERRKIQREEGEAAAAAQERERFIAEKDRNIYDETFAPEAEKEFQERQQNVINQRHDDEVAGWNKLSEDMRNRANIAADANIEIINQRAMNYRLTGDQNVLGTVTPNGPVLSETNEIRNTKEFQDAARANTERERIEAVQQRQKSAYQKGQETRKAAEDARRKEELRKMQEEKDLDAAAKEESDLRNNAAFQVAQKRQQALETGSGKSVQESANSAAAADTSGGPVDMTIDRAMLRQKMGGNKTTWGRKDAEEYLLNNVTKKLEDQQLAIAQNKKLTSEQRLSEWNKHKKEAEDILAEGPGFGDYFFGNKLHYGIGGTAFAAAVGSQAFGGHKSNAELYSSPF